MHGSGNGKTASGDHDENLLSCHGCHGGKDVASVLQVLTHKSSQLKAAPPPLVLVHNDN